jgi:virginiamycin B lyase
VQGSIVRRPVLNLVALGFALINSAPRIPATDFSKLDASTLPIQAKIHVGGNPDWLAIGFGSVWVSVPKNDEIVRINPESNGIEARIKVIGEPCYGIGIGDTHVWVLTCKGQMLTRIRPGDNIVDRTAAVNVAPHGEGAIAVEKDTVWFAGNFVGRVDGHSEHLFRLHDLTMDIMGVGADSAVVTVGFGSVWVTSSGEGKVYRVDPNTLKVTAKITVPATPRFTTIGEGSVWVLSQSDGSVSRIDPRQNKVIAMIAAGVRGAGGDIAYGGGYIWVAASGTPLIRIDPRSNKVLEEYGNYKGADAIRFGFRSIWVSDHGKGDVWRIDPGNLPGH